MNHFFKANAGEHFLRDAALGKLEGRVMEVLWTHEVCSVHEVVERLGGHLAYTTVMTTMARLHSKGLLDRRKEDRAFVYSARISRAEWVQRRVGNFVASFLSGPRPSRELLVSCLLDAVGEHDAELLDDLEKKIRARRKEVSRRSAR